MNKFDSKIKKKDLLLTEFNKRKDATINEIINDFSINLLAVSNLGFKMNSCSFDGFFNDFLYKL